MTQRKSFLLRLDPATHEALQRWADADLRSLNAQIEFLLRRALQETGRLKPGRRGRFARRGVNVMIERADQWTPPDSLGYSSLRPVRLTSQGKALIVIAVGFVIGAVVLGVLLERKVQREAAERTLLRDQGIACRCRRHSCLAWRRKR
jgi:hypothetical protein